jgi:serine/threonine protein kinase
VDDLDDQTECIDREIKIMKLLDHPNIVKLYDIISHRDDKQTFLVLEYVARGELFDYIVANGRIREPESRKFWRQLVSAVEYCHAFLVVHRDLKPSNLLLDDTGSIKITDFGLSNTMTPGKLFTTWCGSLYYSAPEIVEEKKYVGPAVDVWSCGVILYALLNGRLPWSGKCLARDTPVLLHDGRLVPVQDVRVGDSLMGDDATPRTVLSLARGAEPMARIDLRGGGGFTCNVSHVLALKAPRYPQLRREHRVAFVVAQRNADATVAALRLVTHAAASAAAAKALLTAAAARGGDACARQQLKRKLAHMLRLRGDEDALLADEPIDIAVKDLLDAKKVDARLRSALRSYRVGCLQFSSGSRAAAAAAVDAYALAFLVGCGAAAVGESALEFCAPRAAVLKRFASRACAATLRSAGGERWRVAAPPAALRDAVVARGSLDDAALKCGSEQTRRALLDGALDSSLLQRRRGDAALVASVTFVARSLGLRLVVGATSTAAVPATSERFSVTVLPVDQYYGFALDGNRRFVVSDGLVVTHNTDLEKIRQIVVADIAPADRDLSDGCLDLIYGCCTVDVKERLTIPQIRMHPWTNEGYDGPPPCNVPQTQPVAKVSEPVLQQLVFLGILDNSDEAHEQARADIMANAQTQIVYAYHALLGKPQLLVSASFLPRDKIKRAVSAARNEASAAAAGVSSLATKVAGPGDDDDDDDEGDDDDTSSQSSAPPPPPPAYPAPPVTPPHTTNAATSADLQDLSDILGEIDGKATHAAPPTSAQQKAQAAKQQQQAQAAVDALMGDLDALSATITASGHRPVAPAVTLAAPKVQVTAPRSPPPPAGPPPAKATSPPSKKKSTGHEHVSSVETRRRSRTVSAGTGNAKPPATKTAKPKVVLFDSSVTAASAPSSPAPAAPGQQPPPPPGQPPRSLAAAVAARDVQTRKRSMSLGQRSAPKPPPPALNAIPAEASTSASNLTSVAAVVTPPREKTSPTAGSTWTSNLFKRKSKKKEELLAEAAAAAAAASSSSSSSSTASAFATTSPTLLGAASAEPKTAGSTWDPSLYAKAKAAASADAQITDELRTVTGVFKCATTSSRPALELVDAIERALSGMANLKYKRKSRYLFRIADKKSKVRLEIEVVNVEKLERLHGIRFARLQGDTFVYKKLAEEVMSGISGSV